MVEILHNEIKDKNDTISKLFTAKVTDNFNKLGLTYETRLNLWLKIPIAIERVRRGEDPLSIIQFYNLDKKTEEGQKVLIEIAKLAAQQNGRSTSAKIQFFGINETTFLGRQGLIEIAKLAAQQNGYGTSDWIENYKIDNSTNEGQQALIEIAKLAAKQSGEGTSKNIKNYDINKETEEGQLALIEIAKLCARQNGAITIENLDNFGINKTKVQGQQGLIEIAKIVAQQILPRNWGISMYIEIIGIDKNSPVGQQGLMEIAKLSAQHNAKITLACLERFGLNKDTVEEQRKYNDLVNYLFICTVKQLPSLSKEPIFFHFEYFDPKKIPQDGFLTYKISLGIPFSTISVELNENNISLISEKCVDLCKKEFGLEESSLKWIKDKLEHISSDSSSQKQLRQKQFLLWFINIAFLCSMRKDLVEIFKKQDILIQIFKRDPSLRDALTKELPK